MRRYADALAPHLLALIACCSLAVPLTEACAQALDPQRPEVTAFIAIFIALSYS